jgi:hypothetical protein
MNAQLNGPVLKPRLDCNLPLVINGNLSQFRDEYNALADREGLKSDEYGPHTVFALTGNYMVPQSAHRLRVHPKDGETQAFRISQHCDVDSVIGFVYKDDPFPLLPNSTLFYNVFNNTDFTLDSSLHIAPYEFVDPQGKKIVSLRSCSMELNPDS